MTIIGINGKLRTGKGILATKLALAVADEGGKVLSNYSMDSPNTSKIDFYDLVSLLKKPRQEPTVTIVIDELQGWLDSYVGTGKSNRFGSYFLFQSAKLGYDLIYTTQITMRALNSFRELCDYRYCAKVDRANGVFYYYVLDPKIADDDVPTGEYFTITFEQASKWWDRYDTFEAVVPLGMNELFVDMEKHDPERMNATIDRQVSLLILELQRLGARRVQTKLEVEDMLLHLNEPLVFSKYVYLRLRRQLSSRHTQLPQIDVQSTEVSTRIDHLRELLEGKRK